MAFATEHQTSFTPAEDIIVNDTIVEAPIVFTDDFEADTVGKKANYWVENNTTDLWKVCQQDGNRFYGTIGSENATCSWLHVFETNVDVSADLLVPSCSGEDHGRIGLMTRLSGTDAYVLTGFDFTKRKWFIHSCNGPQYSDQTRVIWSDVPSTFEKDRWHQIRVRVVDRHLQLWHNGHLILTTDEIRQITTGRVALYCENSPLYADNIRLALLSGQGRVEDAVLAHYVISDDYYSEGGSLFVHSDELYLFNGLKGHLYLSFDQGSSFRPATVQEQETYKFFIQSHRSQYIRLHNGWILKIDNYTGGQAYLSKDNGVTCELAGKLFDYAAVDPGWDYYGGMNDMLKEIWVTDPDGTEHYRVFYCADCRATGEPDGSGRISYHWEELYYTDDCGYHWHKYPLDTRWSSGLHHYTESRIMPCSDGSLRMFCTYNNAQCVHYLSSYDGGLTWEGEAAIPELHCPRTSYHYTLDEDGTIYMVFVYTDPVRLGGILPRDRFVLIRSLDGIHWEFLMDIWRRTSIPNEAPANLFQTVDPSVTVTKEHLFVTAGWSEKKDFDGPHNAQCQTILRLDKKKLRPYPHFPENYARADDIVKLSLTPPSKVTYRAGETLDLAGGSITVHYYDQPAETLPLDAEGICIQEPDLRIRHTADFPAPDLSVPGEKWLRVTYRSFAAVLHITVTPA